MSTAVMVPGTVPASSIWQRIRPFLLPLAAISVVFVMLVPLPAAALDFLLAISMAASIIVFLSAVQIRRAVELSVFPTLLLLLTLFRLALNIASSRRILLHGSEGIQSGLEGLKSLLGVNAPSNSAAQNKPNNSPTPSALTSDSATLSSAGSQVASSASDSDVRLDKVAGIQAALASGKYSVPPSAVASKMVSSMLEDQA
jgi:flagellar biosynthesis anti-sigma factor FlgM